MNLREGYTLIEILIVLGLTIFLFSAAIQSFIGTSTQFAFNNTAEKVLDMVRFARSLAISGKAFPDYTDFDQDDCTTGMKCQDFVTPANYGINFAQIKEGKDSVVLFADVHQTSSSTGCMEKQYDSTGNPENGCDIIIEKFELPNDMKLVLSESKPSISMFYSPIFADVNFNPELASSSMKVTIKQSTPLIERMRCFSIHLLVGNPEPVSC